jgi:hypothetical protein
MTFGMLLWVPVAGLLIGGGLFIVLSLAFDRSELLFFLFYLLRCLDSKRHPWARRWAERLSPAVWRLAPADQVLEGKALERLSRFQSAPP